jgi:hypothetical protein
MFGCLVVWLSVLFVCLFQVVMCSNEGLVSTLLAGLRDFDSKAKDQFARCLFHLALNPANHLRLCQHTFGERSLVECLVQELDGIAVSSVNANGGHNSSFSSASGENVDFNNSPTSRKVQEYSGKALANLTTSAAASLLVVTKDHVIPRLLALTGSSNDNDDAISAMSALVIRHIATHSATAQYLVQSGLMRQLTLLFYNHANSDDHDDHSISACLILMACFDVCTNFNFDTSPALQFRNEEFDNTLLSLIGCTNLDVSFVAASIFVLCSAESTRTNELTEPIWSIPMRHLECLVGQVDPPEDFINSLTQAPWEIADVMTVVSSVASCASDSLKNPKFIDLMSRTIELALSRWHDSSDGVIEQCVIVLARILYALDSRQARQINVVRPRLVQVMESSNPSAFTKATCSRLLWKLTSLPPPLPINAPPSSPLRPALPVPATAFLAFTPTAQSATPPTLPSPISPTTSLSASSITSTASPTLDLNSEGVATSFANVRAAWRAKEEHVRCLT